MLGRTISHYRVEEKLGAGGMGVVFKARDTLLERTVVLKALPAESSSDAEVRRRFLREARTASSLNHPNIITVHDVVSDDETDFIVMEFVEGRSLAELLGDGLDTGRALEIAIDVGRALAAAHEAGIVHRDIKPANVMATRDGLVKVLDFGLAKRQQLGDGDATRSAPLTQAGMIVGTLNYMSPEQALGREVDARSDVFSLGTLLYEMLTGEQPFARDSAPSILHAVAYEEAADLGEARPGLPAPLGPVLRKAMAKSPDARFQSMSELVAALRAIADGTVDEPTLATVVSPAGEAAAPSPGPAAWMRRWRERPALLAAAGVVIALGIGWSLWRAAGTGGSPRTAAAPAGVPIVGVAPLANLTGDAALDWQGGGIASLVRDNLTQSRHLRVASAARVGELVAAADGEAELATRAAEADVGYLLSGEILKFPDSLTLTVRLSDTANGTELASRLLEGLEPESLLESAKQVADMVRQSLGVPRMEQVDVFAADFASEHMAAYEAYVAGLEFLLRYDYPEAERSLALALELAPDFGAARYRLAQVQAATGRRPEGMENFRRAREEGRLSEREARYVEAAEALYSSRFDEAVEKYGALVETYPFDFELRFLLAESLRASRRWQEEIDQLLVLNRQVPEYRVGWSMLTDAYLMNGQLEQAAATARHLIDTDPDDDNAHILLARALRGQGELAQAAAELRLALELNPEHGRSYLELATVEFLAESFEEAERILERLARDERIHPRNRVQGALDLCFLRRAGGRFLESAAILEQLEPLVAGGVYEAQALSLRGLAALELGDLAEADRLIDLAVERMPVGGAPNRYLLARGLLELARGETEQVLRTAAAIEAADRAPADEDRTEQRAADYLRGLARLAEGDEERAIDLLREASDLGEKDFPYAVYRLALGRALFAAGRLEQALEVAEQAAASGGSENPRLDLELDRVRALLLQAEILSAGGEARSAARLARRFLDRRRGGDPRLPDLALAERLASG